MPIFKSGWEYYREESGAKPFRKHIRFMEYK